MEYMGRMALRSETAANRGPRAEAISLANASSDQSDRGRRGGHATRLTTRYPTGETRFATRNAKCHLGATAGAAARKGAERSAQDSPEKPALCWKQAEDVHERIIVLSPIFCIYVAPITGACRLSNSNAS